MEGTPLGEGRGGGTRRIAGKRWSGDGTAAPGSWRRRRGGQDCRQTVSRPPNALGARTHAGPCNGARQQRSSTRHPPQAPTARPHCRGTAPTPLAPVSRVGGGRHAAAPMSGIRSGGYGRRVSVWRSGATAKLGDPGGAGWRWRNAAPRAVGGGVWPIPRPSAGSSRGRRCWGGGGGPRHRRVSGGPPTDPSAAVLRQAVAVCAPGATRACPTAAGLSPSRRPSSSAPQPQRGSANAAAARFLPPSEWHVERVLATRV